MSEYSAKTLRDKAKARARNLAKPGDYTKDQMTSSADWTPASPINSDVKTGARPISPRAYKRGGAVKKASGGEIADAIVKRDTKRVIENKAHTGGMKCGGMAKRATGGKIPSKQETLSTEKIVGTNKITPTRAKAQHYKSGGKANWIAGAVENKGALHKQLGIAQDKKIPAKTLAKAADRPGKLGKRARLAETLRGFKKADGGGLPSPEEALGTEVRMKGLKVMPSRDNSAAAMVTPSQLRREEGYAAADMKAKRPGRATGGSANASPLSTAAKAVSGKASGGSARKGKTDIKINIIAGGQKPVQPPIPLPEPPAGPMPPVAAPSPAAMPAGPMPGGMPMARKDGGKVSKVASSYKNLKAGSGSGLGRLEKSSIEKKGLDAPSKKCGGKIKK